MKLLLLLFFLTLLPLPSVVGSDLQSDSLALVAVYHQTDGPNWVTKTNWLTGPLNSWHGISVHNGRVEIIQLYSNNLTGPFPKEIGQLSALRELWIHFNRLQGEVPEEISDLVELEVFYINDNELTGPLRPSWGRFTKMREFYVNNNRFTGHIPAELAQMRTTMMFNVSANQLTGPIPPELGTLADLRRLCIWGNQLTGSIPPELGNLSMIGVMQFDNNQLSGSIPPEIGNLSQLRQLRLNQNQLSGELPASMGNLTQLQTMNLSGNRFTGPIPAELSSMTFLITANFSGNQFSGAVPAALLTLPNLMSLQLSDNSFDTAPKLTASKGLAQFSVQNNRLTFKDLLPNAGIARIFTMFPQREFGIERTDSLSRGDAYRFDTDIHYSGNTYVWYRDGLLLDSQTTSALDLEHVEAADAGEYRLEVRNPAAPNTVLRSAPIRLVVDVTTDLEPRDSPLEMALDQNFPNPFNPSTVFGFRLSVSGHTRLTVYDILGREVSVLVNGLMQAGSHTVTFDGNGLNSGMYLIVLQSDGRTFSRKMTLLK